MNGRRGVLLSLLMLAAIGSPVAAQQDTTPKPQSTAMAKHPARKSTAHPRATYPRLVQERPGLLKETTVAPDSATHLALAGMEGARVVARRLVKRGDDLVYVISVRPRRAKVSKRISVDARTGAVLKTTPTRRKTTTKPKAPIKPTGN